MIPGRHRDVLNPMLNRILCGTAATLFVALSVAQGYTPKVAPSGLELDSAAVRKELNLNDAQESAITKIIAKFVVHHEGFISFAPGTDLDDLSRELQSPLTDYQRKQLKEIWLRDEGALALFDPEVAKAVGLTPAQRERLAKINLDMEFESGRAAGGREVKEYSRITAPIRQKSYKVMLAELTPEQRRKWNALRDDEVGSKRRRYPSP